MLQSPKILESNYIHKSFPEKDCSPHLLRLNSISNSSQPYRMKPKTSNNNQSCVSLMQSPVPDDTRISSAQPVILNGKSLILHSPSIKRFLNSL